MPEWMLREMLKSISAKVDGDTIVITGNTFVDGKNKRFMVLRRDEKGEVTEAQKAQSRYKEIWFEEASCF